VIVATLIATIAVIGLAYTFSTGRGFINRFELARAAFAAAEGRLEALAVAPSGDPEMSITPPGSPHTAPFVVDGRVHGTESWTVVWRDMPVDGTGGADPNPNDLKYVTVEVLYQQGTVRDTIRLSRLFRAY